MNDRAEAKKLWRKNRRDAGWAEVRVWVSKDKAQEVKDFAATLPKPPLPQNPNQQELPLFDGNKS
jgi:hypothetical protein